jgi:tryptophan halogenase
LAKQLAIRLGVDVAPSGVRNIDITGDIVEGIDLADGTRVTADLYVDASGREAALIGSLASAQFESWSEWLQCDRLLAASAPRLSSLPAFSQISAFHGGWVGLFPLQDRTAVTAVYSSAAVSDDEVVDLAGVISRLPISGEAVVSELAPGAQRSPWTGNCVSVGDAAIAADPIDAVELQVAHGCISHLVSLFPATAGEFPEADAYNAVIRSFGANLRDFQAAHYLFNRRFDEAFWDRARDTQPPAGLARKAAMFSARASIPLNDDETFQGQNWAALLTGCGIVPQGYDPRVDALPDHAHVEKVQQRLRDVAALARAMPTVDQFLTVEQPSPQAVG